MNAFSVSETGHESVSVSDATAGTAANASLRKVAQLLRCLPAAETAQLLHRLPTSSSEALRHMALQSRDSSIESCWSTLDDFVQQVQSLRGRRQRSAATAREYLKTVSATQFIEYMWGELDVTWVAALMLIPPPLAARILQQLPEVRRQLILERFSSTQGIPNRMLDRLAEQLEHGLRRHCDRARPSTQLEQIRKRLFAGSEAA